MNKRKQEVMANLIFLKGKFEICKPIVDELIQNEEINNSGLFMHVNMLNDALDWARGYIKLLEKSMKKKIKEEKSKEE
jgi:hypothetical protein